MSILSELEKIKDATFGAVFLCLTLLIAPGFGLIFIFKRELLIQLDIIKLVILSISIQMPFLLTNFVVAAMNEKSPSSNTVFNCLILAIILSGTLLYLGLGLG